MTTVWDIARAARLPGVSTTFTFHPAHISTRMRNSIKRMIERGMVEGGWSSKAKHLARALMNEYGLSYQDIGRNTMTMMLPAGMPYEVRQQVLGLLKADFVGLRFKCNQTAEYHRREHDEVCAFLLADGTQEPTASGHTTTVYCADIRKELRRVVMPYVGAMSPDRRALLDLLDGTTPIELKAAHSYL